MGGARAGRRVMTALVVMALSLPSAHAAITDPTSTIDGIGANPGERRIEFEGVLADQPDLAALGIGSAGSWFAHFGGTEAVEVAPTGAGAVDALPEWVAALNHATNPADDTHPPDPGCTEADALARGCLPTYYFRTFSGDGPARSAGGFASWSVLRLPGGECGRSGAIVDPQTWDGSPNNNNTVNRIQLQDGVPGSFYVSVVIDNTAKQHDVGRLAIRGNVGLNDVPDNRSQVEPVSTPDRIQLNGLPDLYVFHVSKFVSGDYLKLGLAGRDGLPAGFAGLLFDTELDVTPGHGARGPRPVPAVVRCPDA